MEKIAVPTGVGAAVATAAAAARSADAGTAAAADTATAAAIVSATVAGPGGGGGHWGVRSDSGWGSGSRGGDIGSVETVATAVVERLSARWDGGLRIFREAAAFTWAGKGASDHCACFPRELAATPR